MQLHNENSGVIILAKLAIFYVATNLAQTITPTPAQIITPQIGHFIELLKCLCLLCFLNASIIFPKIGPNNDNFSRDIDTYICIYMCFSFIYLYRESESER